MLEERSADALEGKLMEGVSVMISEEIRGLNEKFSALEGEISAADAEKAQSKRVVPSQIL